MTTRAHAQTTTARNRAAPRTEGRQTSLPSLVIVCLMVIFVAGLLPLILSSILVSASGDVRGLEDASNSWQARTQELQAEIAALGSLDRIEREARGRLGMVPPNETVYIVVDQPSPEIQVVPMRFLPPEDEQPHHDDSWWESILGLFPLP